MLRLELTAGLQLHRITLHTTPAKSEFFCKFGPWRSVLNPKPLFPNVSSDLMLLQVTLESHYFVQVVGFRFNSHCPNLIFRNCSNDISNATNVIGSRTFSN